MIVPASATASQAASMDLPSHSGKQPHATPQGCICTSKSSQDCQQTPAQRRDTTSSYFCATHQSRLGRWWPAYLDWLTSRTQPRWALWMRYTSRKQHHEASHQSSQITHRALAFIQNMEQMHHVREKFDCGRQAPYSALTIGQFSS